MVYAFVEDGDLGSGEPGSLVWHKVNLRQLNKKQRQAYIRETFPHMTDEDKLEVAVFLTTENLTNGDGN